MPIFSQNGHLLIFWPKFEEIAQLRIIFGSNIVEGVAESWVDAEMGWVEVDARFSNTHRNNGKSKIKVNKHHLWKRYVLFEKKDGLIAKLKLRGVKS